METASLSWELSFMDFAATDAFQIVSMAIQTNSIEWNRMRVRAAFKVEFVWKIHWQLCRQNASFSALQRAQTPMLIFFFWLSPPRKYYTREHCKSSRIKFLSFFFYISQNSMLYLSPGRGGDKKKGNIICLWNLYRRYRFRRDIVTLPD